jgi:hypothetical protein
MLRGDPVRGHPCPMRPTGLAARSVLRGCHGPVQRLNPESRQAPWSVASFPWEVEHATSTHDIGVSP